MFPLYGVDTVLRRIDHRDLLDITKSIPTSLTALNATIFFNGRPWSDKKRWGLKNNYYNGNPEKLKKTIGTVISKKNLSVFEAPKLIVQVISQTGKYGFDSSKLYFSGGGNGPYYGIRWNKNNSHSLHYLQGLLNSELLDLLLVSLLKHHSSHNFFD